MLSFIKVSNRGPWGPLVQKKIFHENCLPVDDSHEISFFIFSKIKKCCKISWISALRVNKFCLVSDSLLQFANYELKTYMREVKI